MSEQTNPQPPFECPRPITETCEYPRCNCDGLDIPAFLRRNTIVIEEESDVPDRVWVDTEQSQA